MDSKKSKTPIGQRINLRMVFFALFVGALVGYPAYLYIESEVTGGIRDAGNGYKSVDLKAMSTFAFDQVNGRLDDIPKKWRDLDGQKVLLRGEMYAPNEAGDAVQKFDLVYSIAKCCFSGTPQVQHFVNSKPVQRLAPNCNGMLIDVYGTLHVNLKQGEGKVESIYQLDVEDVKPVS